MESEVLVIEPANKMSENDKKIERLTRNKNLFEKQLQLLQKKYDRLEQENHFLKRREATLTAIEESLPQRIEKYKLKKAPTILIKELELWEDMLQAEKEKVYEVDDEKNED